MVRKLEFLGANKRQPNLRVFFGDLVSKVENFEYNDNLNIQNKFHDHDHKIRRIAAAKQLQSYYKRTTKLQNGTKNEL
jgi:hypothetical protein